jgi:hypothetical protein
MRITNQNLPHVKRILALVQRERELRHELGQVRRSLDGELQKAELPRGEIIVKGIRFVVPRVTEPTRTTKLAKAAGIKPAGLLAPALRKAGYPVLPGDPYDGTGRNAGITYHHQMLHPW